MKSNSYKNFAFMVILLLSLLSSGMALAMPGAQVSLTGQNNAAVDRPAIQAAIDSAPGQRLTIKLRGTFQLDGQDLVIDRSDVVIKGVRGGATLLGKLGPGGLPIDDFVNFPNRGFLIESIDPLTNIEIKNLTLSGFRSAVFAKGQMNSIDNVQVKNNDIENSIFGFSGTGAVSSLLIANNTMTGFAEDGITIFGTEAGRPADIRIVDNHITEAEFGGIEIFDVDDVIIASNFLSTKNTSDTGVGLVIDLTTNNIFVESNTTEGGVIGMLLLGDATDVTVTKNCILDGGTEGVPFFRSGGIRIGFAPFPLSGSGFEIADNSFSGNVAGDPGIPRDVWLDSMSSNNQVTERSGVVVFDEGSSNSVNTLPEDGVNHCEG